MRHFKITIIAILTGTVLLLGCAANIDYYTIQATDDQAVLFKIATQNKDSHLRMYAVEKLNDQSVLAEIAIKDIANWVRIAAVNKIIDQTLLRKIAIADKVPDVRMAAIIKIADIDQPLLTKIAFEDDAIENREFAIKKIFDQTILTQLALKDKDWGVRILAISKLTDQSLLIKLAKEGDFFEKGAAKTRLVILQNDQTVLSKMAVEEDNWSNRVIAVSKLSDQSLLAKIAAEDGNAFVRGAAMKMLTAKEALFKVAGDLKYVTRDAIEFAARLKLAVQESEIKYRFPNLQESIIIVGTSQKYSPNPDAEKIFKQIIEVQGEEIVIKLIQNDSTIVEESWTTVFPEVININCLIHATVYGEDLLKSLFHLDNFTANDFLELVNSIIPEVRIGIVSNLKDQAILTKVAFEDVCAQVRIAAVQKLMDHSTISKIAQEDKEESVRTVAEDRLKEIFSK